MADFTSIITDADLLQVLSCISSLRSTSLALLAVQDELSQTSSPSASPTPAEIEFSRQQSKLFAYSAQLKSLHRKSILSVRSTKQGTSDARSEIDRLNLQLQNLVYEQKHLRGEIRGCEEYEYVGLLKTRQLSWSECPS
jgi:THO complex subunit 5